jgi:biopolymer transport protein ExbD
MVDVMLVLLAILMVTAPVLENEEPINLPRGSVNKSIQYVKKIVIIVNEENEIFINKTKFTGNNFSDNFLLFSSKFDKHTPIHIKADKELKYDHVMYILKTVKEIGFFKVSLITDG